MAGEDSGWDFSAYSAPDTTGSSGDWSGGGQDWSGWGSGGGASDPGQSFTFSPDLWSGGNYGPSPTPQIAPPLGGGSQPVADWFVTQAGGDPARALGEITRWRGGPSDTPEIRDASHDLWTRVAMQQHPFLARLSAPILAPAYSAAKAVAQGVNAWNPYLGGQIDPWLASFGMDPLVNASPPSLSEIWAGMRPVFRATQR